ncbi:hypothetical protein SCORR_v1c02330 [Spiroplasma corruscae]|uniref:Uncharacterized protein n=1 Tax=Spiroplasma corruscae TaxID=216934 RepID=A0A222ENE8_9MOLU|nr:hypothetical protein [Spiroplasma corruscae]ASP28007.1 hypothetical protein SCORR_v1c02330 [Spiroplasma corruscae]
MKIPMYKEIFNQIIPLTINYSLKELDINCYDFNWSIDEFADLLEELHPVTATSLLKAFKFYYNLLLKQFISANKENFTNRNINVLMMNHLTIMTDIDNSITTFEAKVRH